MNDSQIVARTPSRDIFYSCKTRLVKVTQLFQYLNKQKYDELCRQGCPNYNNKWSCPPYAPDFQSFVKHYKNIDVVMLLVEINEFNYIKQDYLKIKAANSVLKSRLDKALRLCMTESEFYISTGSCRLCKPCKKKIGEKCAHPKEHTYSFEALGLNVSAMTEDLFQTELLWYKKSILPQYTCVVGGLLTNCDASNDKIIEKLKQF